MEKAIKNKIKYLINKGKSGIEICDNIGIEISELFAYVKKLNEEGYACYMDGDNPIKIKESQSIITPDISGKTEYCFLSDLHLGSSYDRVDILRKIYAECHKKGISKIFCCGDITDGTYPDKPHYQSHQKVQGYNNYIYYVCQSIPSYQDITMYAISGNHDDTFTTGEQESILNRIAYFRKDFIYLGKNVAELTVDDTKIRLMHGYNTKKNMDDRLESIYYSIPEEEKPDILALGHIHTNAVRKIDDTLILQCSSLMDTPEFAQRKKFDPVKSCYFVSVTRDDFGNIEKTDVEIATFEEELVRKRVKDFHL